VVDDAARVHVRAESGVDGSIDLAWSIDKSLADFLRVYGTEGEARVGWRESAWRRFGEDWQPIGPGYAKHAAMGGALAQFCRAVAGDEVLEVPASEGVAAALAIDAAYESLRRGGWVKLAELG
jgi:predicted dehydrogenase